LETIGKVDHLSGRKTLIPKIYSRRLLGQLVAGKFPLDSLGLDATSWEKLAAIAQGEGLAPLLYWVMQASAWPTCVPEATCQTLTEAYYASSAYNTLLFHELEKLLLMLKENDIQVVVLKGAALAPAFYASKGLRPMADVDLLIHREDLERAEQVLHSVGYDGDAQDQSPGLHEMADYHVGLTGGPGKRVRAELHWGLVASPLAWYAAPIDWFWQHTEVWGTDNHALQLSPEAQLIYLSGHAMLQHGGSQALLIWLYDIHLLAESGQISWDMLVLEACLLRWSGVVEHALRQVQAIFDTQLPEGTLERLAHSADAEISRLIAFKQGFSGVRLLYDWYSLMALRGMPRLRYVLGMIFPQPAYIHWRYHPNPAWVWPIYYPYRWIRMLAEGLLAIQRGILRAIK
jgi:hypothetical protein